MTAFSRPDLRPNAARASASPPPGSDAELADFAALQERLAPQFQDVFPHREAPRTVVVVPSMTMDQDELLKLEGAHHYEERMLFMLMLLRLPRTRLIFVTSQAINPLIVDYYLHLLPGVPGEHARRRLLLFACHDASPTSLTQKLLDRPRLLERIRAEIPDPATAHMTCFNATPLERTLALRLGIPLYGCDPALAHLGTKSGSRSVFREAGVPMPPGHEDLRDLDDAADALAALARDHGPLRRAVVKLNDGFSGEGNALFDFEGAPSTGLETWIRRELPHRLRFEAASETFEHYGEKYRQMGGVVEAFIEGAVKRSPSAQLRINPLGEIKIISTHDQVLGGPTGQIFLGCTFPAANPYRQSIQEAGLRVGEVLRQRGVLGRFGVDFVSVNAPQGWEHHAIEINLRKGGTTHPYMMLEFLIAGAFDPETGLYRTPSGQPRYYYASDNLKQEAYRGLMPHDLIDIAVYHDLHFDGAQQQGVVFHLLGALSQFGKLGVLCIGESRDTAQAYFAQTVSTLNRETGA
jgi:hypothetical protein